MLDKALSHYSLNLGKLEKSNELLKVAQKHGMRTPDELYILIGYGRKDRIT